MEKKIMVILLISISMLLLAPHISPQFGTTVEVNRRRGPNCLLFDCASN